MAELPPVFEQANIVEIESVQHSKITNINLYPGRAEITRLYKLTVKTGQNTVHIKGLPNVIDQQSLSPR